MMKKNAALLVVLVACGLLFTVTSDFCVVGASVSGIISSDTTWAKSMSPISLSGQIAVNAGVTLTVEAGAVVDLNGYNIQVNGTLVARGTDANPIYFYNGSITFASISSGSIVENAVFQPTTTLATTSKSPNIYINGSSPQITNVANASVVINGGSPAVSQSKLGYVSIEDGLPTLSRNTIYSINLTGGSPVIDSNQIICGINPNPAYSGNSIGSPIITGNDISVCSGSGLAAVSLDFSGDPIISNNIIVGENSTYGVVIGGSNPSSIGGNAYITHNLISGCQAASVLVFSNNSNAEVEILNNTLVSKGIAINAAAAPTVNFNNIEGGVSLKQLAIYSQPPLTASNVNATFNWWGTTSADAINQSIYDFKNDSHLGNVTFTPFLTSLSSQAPVYTPPATPSPTPTETPFQTPSQTQTPTPTETPQQTVFGSEEIALAVLAVALVVLAVVVVVLMRNRKSNPINA
jgi:hypothetical protein